MDNMPTIYINCNGVGKLDEPIAYEFSKKLSRRLTTDFPQLRIVRNLPTSKASTYQAYVADMKKDSSVIASFFVKCRPLGCGRGTRSARSRFLMKSSSFSNSSLPALVWDFLEFYVDSPMWATEANQHDYYLIKHGIEPITLDLGIYDTVNDVKRIRERESGIAQAVSRAVEHYLNPPPKHNLEKSIKKSVGVERLENQNKATA